MAYSGRRDKGDYRWVPEVSGIYRLYHGDNIVYQGQSGNLKRRLIEHQREDSHWGSYDYQSTRGVPTRDRLATEKRAIRRSKPRRNSTYT